VDAGPGYTTVETTDGNTQRREGVRNWRNNNPGNLEYGDFAKSIGAVGSDGRFAVFPTLEMGERAQESLIFGPRYSSLSLEQALYRYAPPGENDTEGYIKSITSTLGISRNTIMADISNRDALLEVMKKHEGFKEGTVIQAKNGGIAQGPESGYMATLHGNELIQPIDPNSILATLATTNQSQLTSLSQISNLSQSLNLEPITEASRKQVVLLEVLTTKIDEMIDKLNDGNDTRTQMMRYSMT
jgi:hypothetical protein